MYRLQIWPFEDSLHYPLFQNGSFEECLLYHGLQKKKHIGGV